MPKTMSFSRPGKIDTGIKGRFFDKYEMTIYGFLSNLYLGKGSSTRVLKNENILET